MKKVLIISILVVSLLSAKQVLVDTNDALSVKVSSNVANIDDNNTNYNSIRNSREEIVIFEWDLTTISRVIFRLNKLFRVIFIMF